MLWITEVVSPGWCLRLRVMMRRTACNITIIMIIIIIQLKKRGEGKERKSRNISLFSSVFLHFHFCFSRILAAAAAASCWLHLTFISYQRRKEKKYFWNSNVFLCYIVGRTARMTAGQNYWKCDTYNKSAAIVNVWIMKNRNMLVLVPLSLRFQQKNCLENLIWISLKSSRFGSECGQLCSRFISLFVVWSLPWILSGNWTLRTKIYI